MPSISKIIVILALLNSSEKMHSKAGIISTIFGSK